MYQNHRPAHRAGRTLKSLVSQTSDPLDLYESLHQRFHLRRQQDFRQHIQPSNPQLALSETLYLRDMWGSMEFSQPRLSSITGKRQTRDLLGRRSDSLFRRTWRILTRMPSTPAGKTQLLTLIPKPSTLTTLPSANSSRSPALECTPA